MPVPPRIITRDMKHMEEELLPYQHVWNTPLTRHLSQAAAAYEECCAAIETYDHFYEYLTNIKSKFERVLDDINSWFVNLFFLYFGRVFNMIASLKPSGIKRKAST